MKPATAKAKGRDRENRAVRWLSAFFPQAERRRLQGSADQGDVAGCPELVVEVKSAAEWKPVQWLRELDAEMLNAGVDQGIVMAAPKGKLDVEEWVILMHPQVWIRLMREAGRIPDPV